MIDGDPVGWFVCSELCASTLEPEAPSTAWTAGTKVNDSTIAATRAIRARRTATTLDPRPGRSLVGPSRADAAGPMAFADDIRWVPGVGFELLHSSCQPVGPGASSYV